MSKRKNSDEDYKYLAEKLRKLEREVHKSRRNKRRVRCISSDSSSAEPSPSRHVGRSEPTDRQIEDVLDVPGPSGHYSRAPSEDLVTVLYGGASTSVPVRTPLPAAPATPAAPPGPPPAAPAEPAALEPGLCETDANADIALDSDLMEILGIDPTKSDQFGPDLHKEIAIRFEHCVTTGLTKETRKELTDKYKMPANCKLVDAPSLNPEVKAALSLPILNRDKAIEAQQRILASAISSLGEAITLLLSFKEKQPELLRLLINSGRLLCDRQHKDSEVRRQYILSSLKPEMKEQLKITKIDSLLFGQNFQETLKTAKAINKSGSDLKTTNPFVKPSTSTPRPVPSTSKNWRSSNQNLRKPAAARKETTLPTTSAARRAPRGAASRASQRPRAAPPRR